MAFLTDAQELKPGLIIFRRADVKHQKWYCRIKVPKTDRYKTVSLKTTDIDAARERAFDHDADVRFRIKHEVPIFNRPFSQIAKDYVDLQKERAEAGQIAPARWKNVDSIVRVHLNPYVGSLQINLVGQDNGCLIPSGGRRNVREGRGKYRRSYSGGKEKQEDRQKRQRFPPGAEETQEGQGKRQRRLDPLRDVDLSGDHGLCREQEIHSREPYVQREAPPREGAA